MTPETNTTGRLHKILHHLGRWMSVWLLLFMLSMIPPVSSWLNNRDQVTIQDLLFPAAFGLILGGIITAAVYWSYRTNRFAAVVGGVAAVLIVGQGYNGFLLNILLKVYTRGGDRFVLLFAVLAVTVGIILFWLLHKYTRRWTAKTDIVAKGIYITITIAFLISIFPLVRISIVEWPQFFYRPAEITAPASLNAAGGQPDIYYIVLDRYASQSVLKEQFNFDNADFINFLTENKFYVDPDAYSNYPFTTMSISSTLNMGYHTDLVQKFAEKTYQTVQPYHDAIHYSSVIKKLKSLGYSYYHLGTWYEATSPAPLADYYYQPEGQLTILNHRFTLSDFMKRRFFDSIFRYIVRHTFTVGNFTVWGYSSQSTINATLGKFDQLKKIASAPAGGRFVFAHILSPHYPYYFNADGSLSKTPGFNNVGKPVKEKYTGQMEFINSQMQIIIEAINKNSNGQAIIIVQADEGEYPVFIYNDRYGPDTDINKMLGAADMTQLLDDEIKLKFGILAAYHLPQATAEAFAQGGNSVNIFRLVFNTYFGAQLPYLPKCYYAYPKGRATPFDYANINKRLTGQDNPGCSDNGS